MVKYTGSLDDLKEDDGPKNNPREKVIKEADNVENSPTHGEAS